MVRRRVAGLQGQALFVGQQLPLQFCRRAVDRVRQGLWAQKDAQAGAE